MKALSRTSWWILFAGLTLILGIGLTWLILVRKTVDITSQVVDSGIASIAGAFRPEISVSTTVMTTLGEIHKNSKLVVMTATIDVSITQESRKTILWDLLDLGTTTVSVDLPGNKVQYVILVDSINQNSFEYEGNQLKLTVPAPVADEEIVELHNDPRQIRVRTETWWARLKSRSGEQLRQQALAEVRSRVLEQARAEPLMLAAESRAESELRKLLSRILEGLRPGVTLEIKFKR